MPTFTFKLQQEREREREESLGGGSSILTHSSEVMLQESSQFGVVLESVSHQLGGGRGGGGRGNH